MFGMLNPQKIWPENLTDLSASPVRCSHFTSGNPKKSFSTVLFIHTYLCYLRPQKKKQTVIHLPTPSENVTILTCEMQKCLIWLQVCCVLSNVGGSEGASCGLSSVSLKTTGIGNVRQATSQKVFRVTTFCTMFPVFFDTDQSHSTPRCSEIQPMSQQAAAASFNMSVSIHALLL